MRREALRLGLKITGLGLAHRLQRWSGKQRALSLGMWLAEQRFAREREHGLAADARQAIGAFSSLVPASMGAFGCHYDTAGAEALGDLPSRWLCSRKISCPR